MPRYFFHVHDSSGELHDGEGRHLPDLSAARRAAVEGARSLICAGVIEGKLDLEGAVRVTDEAARPVVAVSYRSALGLPEE